MYSPISYILRVLKRGGSIVVTNYIKLYDEGGNFVCYLSDTELESVKEEYNLMKEW